MPEQSDDVLIVGGGHNGLCCAGYLAARGMRVRVLERRALLGGACISEEIEPGFTVSTASYVVSLLADQVVDDLQLRAHGYEVLARQPSSFTPWRDGGLFLGANAEENRRQISQFSQQDAEAFGRYEAWLSRIASVLEPIMEGPAPDILPLPDHWRCQSALQRIRNLFKAWQLRGRLSVLGDELPAAMELLLGPARPMLERWFESDVLRCTLASDAIIGANAPPSASGTGYVLLHHVMGSAGGARGVWGYVRGGMGGITQAMSASASARGVQFETQVEVAQIDVENGRAVGVRSADGRSWRASRVIVNAPPAVTARLLGQAAPQAYADAVSRIDYSSASAKINLSLSHAPNFLVAPHQGSSGDAHRGTIHISPPLEQIELGWAQAMAGALPEQPIIEMTIPSAVDQTLAPEGAHVAQLFVQYVPYGSSHSNPAAREQLLAACVRAIEQHAPGFGASVRKSQVLLPEDLESRFGLTGGNIFHGAMSLHQLFSLRPVPGWSDHRTPVMGLYLCGAGCHPGGGVSGLPGRHAALAVIADS